MYKDINEIVAAYNAAKARESAAKKEKDLCSAMILEYANGAEFFETDDFRVMLGNRSRSGIDTKKLYKDFPDIKDVYGTTTTYTVIDAQKKESAGKKSA